MTIKEKIAVLKDGKIRNFIVLQILFNGLVTILTLFINTFIMKSNGGSSNYEVLLYNLIQAVMQPLAMMTSFLALRKRSYLFVQRMGFGFYGVALSVLCIWGEKVAFLYPLFGILISFGAGYYFGIYSVQTIAYTTDDNRDLVSGATTALCSIIAVTLPLIAGLIISAMNAYTGYRVVFAIATLLAFSAIFITTRLSPIIKPENKFSFWQIFCKIVKNRNGRRILIANGLDNCRSYTISFYIMVLIYNLIQSEIVVSVNSTIGSILAILGAALYGILINRKNRTYSILLSVIIVFIPCAVMFFKLNVFVLILFYALNSFCNAFMSTPVFITHFKVMESIEGLEGMGAQIHAVRELFVSMGRILGILMIICIPQTNVGCTVILSALILTSLVNTFLVKKIESEYIVAV